jgi:AraC family transcriptional regulator
LVLMQISIHPVIKTSSPKKLIGKRLRMSLANSKTMELWRSFMPRRKEIKNSVSSELVSMQVYLKPVDPKNFDMTAEIDKWAAIEVNSFETIPEGMESFELPGGLYAVFTYKGATSAAASTFQYFFCTWLPASKYELDHRPQFEILGEKYKNEDPDSEEDIWIPVRLRN